MGSSKELHLPYFGIQCDWDEALSGGKVWVSVRSYGQDKSVHGEIKRISSGEIKGTDPFIVVQDKTGGRFVTVRDQGSKEECTFIAPASVLDGIHKMGVISMDVSEGGLGVSICRNNEMKVWESGTGSVRRKLMGHPIDAYHCRFFPSGIVILSGGSDCCLKIWSAETGDCPVTLKGHTQSIQDTAIIERGRNVVSVAKDGSARLWDCGEGKCLDVLVSCVSAINTCLIMTPRNYELGHPIENMSNREIMTNGKLLVLGCEDGKVIGISIAARKEMFKCNAPSAVNKVIQVGPSAFAAGCQGGDIVVYRLEDLAKPLTIKCSTQSPVLDMLLHPTHKSQQLSTFWVSKTDGTCLFIDPNAQAATKTIQLTGPNYDPVYQIKSDLDFIYTASRDGFVRKYSLRVINRFI